MDNSTQTSLALDDGVRDAHLTAQSGKEDDQLNGVDVVGDQNQRSLLVLDQADNVVETVLDVVGLLADVLLLLALSNSGGLTVETLPLLDLGLRAVLVEELEGLGSGVAVQGVLELGDGRGDLEAHVQDLLLALKTNILRPLDEAGQVALRLDVLADTEVTGALLDEGVLIPSATVNRAGVTANSPWQPSCWHQPYPGGRAWARPSFRSWEAIIEKRRSANCPPMLNLL